MLGIVAVLTFVYEGMRVFNVLLLLLILHI